MSKIEPKQRLEFFLAKIAGEDVDISTLVPPVATNQIEKILLAIAEKMGDSTDSVDDLDEKLDALEKRVAALEKSEEPAQTTS